MIVELVTGAGVGLGVLAVVRGLRPPRPPLATVLARHQRAETTHEAEGHPDGAAASGLAAGAVGRLLAGVATAFGLRLGASRRNLTVTGRSLQRHLAEKAGMALFGLALAPLTAGTLALVGVRLPLALPLWAAVALAVGGFFLPDLDLRADAARRRRELRQALGSLLDLTVIGLAGGAGVEGALADAANAGEGFGPQQLRRALATARLRREPPWVALGRLGEELDVAELVELAASVGLAGTEGARVRESLAAKAASLRAHQLADAETQAQASTEQMSLPVVLLFAGFLLFIGYPAMARVMTGL
jgi:Flp pilus assembly protein TadB